MLRLEVREFTDLTRWRWTLTEANGAFLADHEVRLDPAAERFEAFTSLHDYVSWHAAPDKRPAEEARIVTGLGDWTGTEVFGPAIGAALVKHRPATVEVVLPEGAEALAFLPLESARVQGRSLAGHGITLVIRPQAPDGPQPAPPPGNRLRVLGLFSLPEGGSALNLRRERQSLVGLIGGIAANGRAADIRVVQYGVTRDRLRDILEEAEGWDILHLSGHGTPGELVLETAAGTPDPVTAGDLADLLEAARGRVKLITLSACSSAALTTAGQRRLLGLPVPEDQDQNNSSPERITATAPSPGALATELTSRLGCAVLAMRFPVGDEFAIALAGKLYDLLARQGQPLPRAVALTLSHLTHHTDQRFPALSLAAPAIFGAAAAGLTLKAPERTGSLSYATGNLKLAGFPPQPDRFVGRTAVMARSSAALAAGSRVPGVLLHGMPGGGKTACALELACTHEHAFDRLVWFKAPDEGMAIDGALTDFALTLERELPGFEMIHVLADDAKLTAFLPKLTQLLEERRLLIVIDNAESLLTDTGQWRDQQWGKVFGALTGHTGFGRVIVTSRRVPAGAPDAIAGNAPAGTRPGLQVEAVDALTADEALLLASELPNLRALMYGALPGIDRETSRRLARGVLNVAQGHPKLLELADGQAANPEQLAALTEAGDQAWRDQGGLPDGFFTSGESAAAPGDYLHILAAWTKSVTDTLTPGERDLFWFLCCLEEPDRIRPVLNGNWTDLWQQLNRDGQPPALDQALTAITTHGLAAIWPGAEDRDESYTIHPGVAAAGRNRAGEYFQDTADTEAAAYWNAVFKYASGENRDGSVHTGLMTRAGLAAGPYLIRREQWGAAGTLLGNAFILDPSRGNAAAVLPTLQRVISHDPSHRDKLATVLQALDPAAAETQMRTCLDAAITHRDYGAASRMAGQLTVLCCDDGRLAEALNFAEQAISYTKQAGLGSWTQLLEVCRRLQVLNAMGQATHVLAEVQQLRGHMATLPAIPGPDEAVHPWDVCETLLGTGREAARLLGQYDDALDLNAAHVASKRERRATAASIARTRFNDYGPLIRLGRAREALDLLLECRQVFYDTGDIRMLGKTLSALASTENLLGHGDAALRLECDAFRYKYFVGDVVDIAVGYYNLGHHLSGHTRQASEALTAHLTAALIYDLTGMGGTGDDGAAGAVHSAAVDLREFGTAAEPPADIADLCDRLADIEGTDLPALIETLSPDPETAEQTLRDLITQARQLAETPPGDADHG